MAQNDAPDRVGGSAFQKRGGTRLVLSGLAAFVLTVYALPYLWMFFSGFKTKFGILEDATPLSIWTLLPREPTFDNFIALFAEHNMARFIMNSLIVTAAEVLLVVVVCSLAGYGLSRLRFPGRGLVFAAVLVSFMIPFDAIVIPLFEVVRTLGFTNTYFAVFLPFIASPLAVFVFRQAFDEVPQEMLDAGRIDGASEFQLYRRVALPMIGPAIATVVLLTFIGAWNSFLWPLIVLNDRELQVVQIAIANSARPGITPEFGLIFAGATIATIPALLVFLSLQRFFVRGISLTGMKA
jgi:ABC-type glycerol-3-phosphate transport system permease component